MEYNNKLYISTNNGNQAHKQLRENGNIQIVVEKRRDKRVDKNNR